MGSMRSFLVSLSFHSLILNVKGSPTDPSTSRCCMLHALCVCGFNRPRRASTAPSRASSKPRASRTLRTSSCATLPSRAAKARAMCPRRSTRCWSRTVRPPFTGSLIGKFDTVIIIYNVRVSAHSKMLCGYLAAPQPGAWCASRSPVLIFNLESLCSSPQILFLYHGMAS